MAKKSISHLISMVEMVEMIASLVELWPNDGVALSYFNAGGE